MTDIVSRVVTTFPALVEGTGGVTIDKSAGVYTVGFDFNTFWSVTGDILARNDDGNPQAVSTGAAGTVLTSTGVGLLPEYVAIGSPQIPDGSIGTLQLADESVTTPKLAPEAVTAAKMAPDSVGTSALIDLNVTNAKLGLLSVATDNIQADAVTDEELADNSVDTAAIIDANVTLVKMAANSVDAAKIVDDSVGQAEIAPNAVDLTEMALQARGDLITYDTGGNAAKLAIGTANQVLKVNSAGTDLEYGTGGGVTFADVATTRAGISTTEAVNPLGLEAYNGPRFQAKLVSQAVPANTWTKLQANVEDYDTDSDYDAVTNYRFTPSVAGWYFVYSAGAPASAAGAICGVSIYFNGVLTRAITQYSGAAGNPSVFGFDVFQFNGTTDYAEMYGFSSGAIPDVQNILFGAFRISP